MDTTTSRQGPSVFKPEIYESSRTSQRNISSFITTPIHDKHISAKKSHEKPGQIQSSIMKSQLIATLFPSLSRSQTNTEIHNDQGIILDPHNNHDSMKNATHNSPSQELDLHIGQNISVQATKDLELPNFIKEIVEVSFKLSLFNRIISL